MRYRIAIPAVVAVDIEAESAEEALAIAAGRQQRLHNEQDHPSAEGEQLHQWGKNAALWGVEALPTYPGHRVGPEIWDQDAEEPLGRDHPDHPDYEPPEPDGEAFRGGEAAAYQQERMDEARRLK